MATYYAGVGGSDANAGTSYALRKLTIQAAINIATTAGDTILVSPGTYRETVTFGTSGSAGNVISLIGDYTGANTSGSKGIVRITGSADDIALTRATCITAVSKNYLLVSGFVCDTSSNVAVLFTSCTNSTISKLYVVGPNSLSAVQLDGASTAGMVIDSCYVVAGNSGSGLAVIHSATVAVSTTVKNCVLLGGAGTGQCFILNKVTGVTISNCVAMFGTIGFRIGVATGAAGSLTVNNSVCAFNTTGFSSVTLGELVEDYNTIFGCSTARTNTNVGANSVTRPPLFDTRWFFEAANGGRMVTPFDLASYSTLVEYNSGTGAPSTDMRGASVVGTYREWGANEFDANYRIGGPVSIAPIGGIG